MRQEIWKNGSIADEARRKEEERLVEEVRKAEEKRLAEEACKAEEERLTEEAQQKEVDKTQNSTGDAKNTVIDR